jgi:antitoxin VapB
MLEAKLFKNGNSQAVRLPKTFRFPGTAVLIKRYGAGVLLLPIDHDPWQEMAKSLEDFTPELRLSRDQGRHQSRPPLEAPKTTRPATPKRPQGRHHR